LASLQGKAKQGISTGNQVFIILWVPVVECEREINDRMLKRINIDGGEIFR